MSTSANGTVLKLWVVDRFFPSSKTCFESGHVQDMPLSLRTYDCPDCDLSIDRDLNASINLRERVRNSELSISSRKALPTESKTHSRNAVGSTVNACG
ncbi:MAG: transposase [Okeania sp. SIO2C2]|uniref:zinc ribbon domain-containing protein n=1 Tax=Okeania sp. SIO2C2 TaxID=2607787 RepID=UPI0013BA5556|nr:transposase [Okeania sp. SIO2C2]